MSPEKARRTVAFLRWQFAGSAWSGHADRLGPLARVRSRLATVNGKTGRRL